MNIVKLADSGDSRQRHFAKREARYGVEILRLERIRRRVHLLAPRPEAVSRMLRAMLSPPANEALKRVRMCIDHARQQCAPAKPSRVCWTICDLDNLTVSITHDGATRLKTSVDVDQ